MTEKGPDLKKGLMDDFDSGLTMFGESPRNISRRDF